MTAACYRDSANGVRFVRKGPQACVIAAVGDYRGEVALGSVETTRGALRGAQRRGGWS